MKSATVAKDWHAERGWVVHYTTQGGLKCTTKTFRTKRAAVGWMNAYLNS